ncbi:ABC transporter substrate-binding protein [Paenibacillus senegalimassiliensis]|uniref:ABC transporter substrate-binding protein n=1 Tax=Paenibacillus senegalimassiliensis TaxID=1737426 RepID=UPI00073F010E|nr:ABC transporter substrate-binding protein [Paenibacillus senegalimassiliensis]
MKRTWLSSVCLVLAIALTACGSNGGAASSPSEGPATSTGESNPQYGTVELMLDWYPNAVHSYLYVAQEKGYFEEEGVKVNIQTPANATDPINLAASGAITLGITYQPDVIMARATQNVPVVSIASIVRTPLNRVLFMPDAGISSPKDLEGKKVGYPGIPLNESIITSMVRHDGGDPSKVDLIDVGFTLGSSLVSGNVDAIVGAYINHEVPALSHEGYETSNMNPTDYGVPNYYELVIVTNEDTWAADEDKIRAFWRGASKGYQFMKSNPQEALALLLDMQDKANFPLVQEVEEESLSILLDLMETGQEFGYQSAEEWQSSIDWMQEAGLIENPVDTNSIFRNLVD